MNAVEIEEAITQLAESEFDAENFPFAFLEAFGNKPATIKPLKSGSTNSSDIEGGVLQRNNIHIAVCETGKVAETLQKLKESPSTKKGKSKFLVATDGVDFEAEDLVSDEPPETFDSDEALLAELEIEAPKEGDVTLLKYVKTRAEKKAAEEIASRDPCENFHNFTPLFDQVQQELSSGIREAKLLTNNAQINQGDWFILYGQKAYVAEVSEQRIYGFDKNDYRLRVIYDNATESDLLMRSLQRVLDKDEAGRRIIELSAGPLFDDIANDDDQESGTIYVLRSCSNHPTITANRDVIHNIGVTGGSVEKRISNAKLDPTYLMADVEVVATYQLYNINRTKLEKLIHRFFEQAKLEIEIKDRFGNPVVPQEWFLAPVNMIDEAVSKVIDQSISKFKYDAETASIVDVVNSEILENR